LIKSSTFVEILWNKEDSNELKSQKSAMIGFSALMWMGGLLWGSLCLLDNLLLLSIMPFSYSIIIMPIIGLCTKYKKKFYLFANIQLSISLLIPFLFQWTLGGLSSSGVVMLWALSALIGSLLVVGPKKATIWYFFYITLVIFSGIIDPHLNNDFGKISISSEMLTTINIFFVTSMIFVVNRHFTLQISNNQKELLLNVRSLKDDLSLAYEHALRKDKMAVMGEIAAGVGHEVNNPLTIASSYSEKISRILVENGIINLEINESLEKQQIAYRRIRDIIDGLRVFSRTNSKKVKINCLDQIILQSVDLVKEIYKNEDVKLDCKVPNDNVFVKGDFGELQQVILNLLQNAKDATEDVKEKIVTISLERQSMAIILISDNGKGVPEDIKEKIFEPFFTTKRVGKGTGIGLGIVSKIVSNMNGAIELKSTNGEGSTFKLSFPMVNMTEIEQPKESITESFDTVKNDLYKNILIVEDEKDIRELLREILESKNCKVDEAANGFEALELLSKATYDVIFSDLAMPKMDGLSFIKEIPSLNLPLRPVIILTSGDVTLDETDDEMCTLVDSIISKPYLFQEIIDALKKSEP
jgi:signal transduction histidine kinase/CheY-like chemotaxis protein